MPHLTQAGCSQGFGRDIGLQAKEEPASRSQDPPVNADMLSDRVHIPECPLKWAGGIQRGCATYEVGEIDRLHGRGNSMPIGQTDLGPLTRAWTQSHEGKFALRRAVGKPGRWHRACRSEWRCGGTV